MDQFYAALWTYFAPPLTVVMGVDWNSRGAKHDCRHSHLLGARVELIDSRTKDMAQAVSSGGDTSLSNSLFARRSKA